jgi:hypothetical protein
MKDRKKKKPFDVELMPVFWLGEFLNGDVTVLGIGAPLETIEKPEGFKDRVALCGVKLDWKTGVWLSYWTLRVRPREQPYAAAEE